MPGGKRLGAVCDKQPPGSNAAAGIWPNAAIDETALPLLAIDQRATITFPGSDALMRGRVSWIAWEADRQTHELLVEVTPEQLDRRVAIGQRADVRIELGTSENALVLPSKMIYHDHAGAFVYVDRQGRIAMTRPRFGRFGTDTVDDAG